MTTRGDKRGGLSMTAAGVGIMGAAVVFGLTSDTGDLDWIGIITVAAGAVMAIIGLLTAYRNRRPRTA